MADVFFEIEYIERCTGGAVVKIVSDMRLAQKLAKELAIAHGRVAKIRRVRRGTWALITVDLATGRVHRSDRTFTRREVLEHWKHWKAKREQAVCLPWPGWAPPPTITIVLQRGA